MTDEEMIQYYSNPQNFPFVGSLLPQYRGVEPTGLKRYAKLLLKGGTLGYGGTDVTARNIPENVAEILGSFVPGVAAGELGGAALGATKLGSILPRTAQGIVGSAIGGAGYGGLESALQGGGVSDILSGAGTGAATFGAGEAAFKGLGALKNVLTGVGKKGVEDLTGAATTALDKRGMPVLPPGPYEPLITPSAPTTKTLADELSLRAQPRPEWQAPPSVYSNLESAGAQDVAPLGPQRPASEIYKDLGYRVNPTTEEADRIMQEGRFNNTTGMYEPPPTALPDPSGIMIDSSGKAGLDQAPHITTYGPKLNYDMYDSPPGPRYPLETGYYENAPYRELLRQDIPTAPESQLLPNIPTLPEMKMRLSESGPTVTYKTILQDAMEARDKRNGGWGPRRTTIDDFIGEHVDEGKPLLKQTDAQGVESLTPTTQEAADTINELGQNPELNWSTGTQFTPQQAEDLLTPENMGKLMQSAVEQEANSTTKILQGTPEAADRIINNEAVAPGYILEIVPDKRSKRFQQLMKKSGFSYEDTTAIEQEVNDRFMKVKATMKDLGAVVDEQQTKDTIYRDILRERCRPLGGG